MKFLSKATMPVTLEIDDDGTIATKSYVDAAVASVGGGFEDLGEFDNDEDVIMYTIMNNLKAGRYTLIMGTVPTAMYLFRDIDGGYHATLIADGLAEASMEANGDNLIVFQYRLAIKDNSDRISNLEDQLSGLETLLGGI